MSKLDEKMRDKAAIYLEEMGVSGDAQIGIDAEHAPHKEMIGGAYHIHDLIADYAQSQLQELREMVKEAAMGEGFMYTNEILNLIDQLQED